MTLAETIQTARAEGVAAHEAGEWLSANPYTPTTTQSAADNVRTNAAQRAWRRGWLSIGTPLDNLDTVHRVALGVSPAGDQSLEHLQLVILLERGDATKVAR